MGNEVKTIQVADIKKKYLKQYMQMFGTTDPFNYRSGSYKGSTQLMNSQFAHMRYMIEQGPALVDDRHHTYYIIDKREKNIIAETTSPLLAHAYMHQLNDEEGIPAEQVASEAKKATFIELNVSHVHATADNVAMELYSDRIPNFEVTRIMNAMRAGCKVYLTTTPPKEGEE